ncbi:MAG: hypothetical protein DRI90_28650 [Deltaproteobacteria bacterium]|nr:MAG: hypothetical protein DRI90_28650 [Deltaproteobacteria bacterium]
MVDDDLPERHPDPGDEATRPEDLSSPEAAQVVTFRSGHRAEIVRGQPSESLTLRSRDGHCMLAIEITDQGALLRLTGDSLEIAATSTLSLQAKHLELKAGALSVDIDGDLTERVAGDVRREVTGGSALTAKSVAVEATPGGVAITANDDVDLSGERVRLNCDDPPMPLTWEEFQQRRGALAAPDEGDGELTASHEKSSPPLPEED